MVQQRHRLEADATLKCGSGLGAVILLSLTLIFHLHLLRALKSMCK